MSNSASDCRSLIVLFAEALRLRREALRSRHDSRLTSHAYLYWIRRFLMVENGIHLSGLAESDRSHLLKGLIHLAISENVSRLSTEGQALDAVLSPRVSQWLSARPV